MKWIAAVRLVKMACRASALTIALAMANPVAAAEPAPATASAVPDQPGPALWVVRDEDSTLYLFGTMHALNANSSWNTPRIMEAVAASQEIWFETEPPQDPSALQSIIMRLGSDPANPLSSRLSPADYQAFSQAITGMGLQPSQMDPMRPWLAALTLSTIPMMQAGYDPAAGADAVLLAAARATGRMVRTFESTEQQMNFFADLPPAVELQFLRETLAAFQQGPEVVRQIERLWTVGDAEGLWRLAGEPMRSGFPEVYRSVITGRNQAWVQAIERELAGSGTDFVAVGALHLAGPDSVQSMLQAHGYRVERR